MTDLAEPTLVLDQDICKNNILRMAKKADSLDVRFKPHMKTHQSATTGRWLRDAGVEAITVSSLKMAEYFADNGWSDITIAFPCNIRQIKRLDNLASTISLTLLINNLQVAEKLDQELTSDIKAYIEIDTGSGRTGHQISEKEVITELIQFLNTTNHIDWIGFYSHPGHSYQARKESEIQNIHQTVVTQFRILRNELEPQFGPIEICIGDTPCCSKGEEFAGIDAISPGNFVFYDLMQTQIGSCSIEDIAVAMACPVVEKYPQRTELAIHGGAIHFSKEQLEEDAITHYGKVAKRENGHWKILDQRSYLNSLSQEHGIIKCSSATFKNYEIGDMIWVLPVHSCLTANLMKHYQLLNGKEIHQMSV